MYQDPKRVKNLAQLLDQMVCARGDRPAIRYLTEGGDSYVEISSPCFFNDIKECARYYQAAGLASGHVGLMGTSRYEWLVNQYALWIMGNVTVLLGDSFTSDEILSCADQADLVALLADQDCLAKAKEALADQALSVIPMWTIQDRKNQTIEDDFQSFCPQVRGEDPAVILFTSGTTGDKKAVVLSHRGIIAGVANNILGPSFESQMVILPFHHLAGFNPVLYSLCQGAMVCLCGDFKNFFQGLEVMKPDYVFAVPALARILARRLKHGGIHGEKLGWNLKILNCGGARFTPEVVDSFVAADIMILQSYGASEMGGIGFTCQMTLDNPDTIGACNEYIEARLVDGELMIRSDSLMTGYYKDPVQTKEVIVDGWYSTGDLARMDDRGYYYITGRKKNLIITSNGENISPEELEKHLSAIPQVKEVLVFEEKDLLAAMVVPEAEEEGIKEGIRSQVAAYNEAAPSYKRIASLYFRKTPLLKNPMMKLIRTQNPFQEENME